MHCEVNMDEIFTMNKEKYAGDNENYTVVV